MSTKSHTADARLVHNNKKKWHSNKTTNGINRRIRKIYNGRIECHLPLGAIKEERRELVKNDNDNNTPERHQRL